MLTPSHLHTPTHTYTCLAKNLQPYTSNITSTSLHIPCPTQPILPPHPYTAISHVLLAALQDPSPKRNQLCLEILLETSFDNFFDAPSLALIMPVVIRAFNSRSTETRKMSSQLIGTMYSITDQKVM